MTAGGRWFEGWRLGVLLGGTVGLLALVGVIQTWPSLWQPYTYYKWPSRDDYEEYHHYAVDVVERGLAMRASPAPYVRPAGFLFIYFVALCYRLFGVHPPIVFVVQSAMLGASVALLFLTFRRGLSARAQIVLLGGLAAFAFLDMGRHYALQLFSENLLIFGLALFCYLTRLGFVDHRRWARIPALAVLGAIPLVRPNALLFVPAALAWLAIRRRRGPRVWRDTALGIVCLAAVLSLMGLRNYMAGGGWVMFTPTAWYMLDVPGYGYQVPGAEAVLGPVERRQGAFAVVRLAAHAVWHDPARVLPEYARRILFVAGFVPLKQPGLRYRPHWTLRWVGLGVALAWRLRRGPRQGPMVELLFVWLVTYLGPLVVMSSIDNYGFRYVVPGVLPAVAGAVVLAAGPRTGGTAEAGWHQQPPGPPGGC
jgi:Dolichyl-phosphate-mannose-protein mannosyltransferase